jgi:hypothetical protein
MEKITLIIVFFVIFMMLFIGVTIPTNTKQPSQPTSDYVDQSNRGSYSYKQAATTSDEVYGPDINPISCNNQPQPTCISVENGEYKETAPSCPGGVNWVCDYYDLGSDFPDAPEPNVLVNTGSYAANLDLCDRQSIYGNYNYDYKQPVCGWGSFGNGWVQFGDYGARNPMVITGYHVQPRDKDVFQRIGGYDATKSFEQFPHKSVEADDLTYCEKQCGADCFGYTYKDMKCNLYKIKPVPLNNSITSTRKLLKNFNSYDSI